MKIALATALYCGLMLFSSCFYYGAFFDPIVFLWAFFFTVVGPALAVVSFVLLVQSKRRRTTRPTKVASRILCILVVAVWSFGYWRIGDVGRSVVFALVAKSNERLAVSLMQQHPPDVDFETRGFRYPFCPLFPYGSLRASHHAGVFSIRMPAGPGNMDFLVYVSPGSSMDFPPPTLESMGQGYEVKNVGKNWFYVRAVGI